MKSERPIMIMAAVLVAAILIGQIAVYTTSEDRYRSDFERSATGVDCTMSSPGSKVYDAILIDNGQCARISELYIFFDVTYAENYEKAVVAVGARTLSQEYYISQLVKSLELRGFVAVKVLNAADLAEKINADLVSGTTSKGLVVLSGAFPDTIYKGNSTDILMKWISAGGSVYWAGNLIGSCYSTVSGTVPVAGYQELFFGAKCLNTVGIGDPSFKDTAFYEVGGNNWCKSLTLSNNRVKYAVDPSKLTTDHLAAGFTESGFASIVIAKHGAGSICVLGGTYSNNQRGDMSQIIASGLTYCSKELVHKQGEVSKQKTKCALDTALPPASNIMAYVYYGGYFPVHGYSEPFKTN